ncbi:hypothetical protein ACPA9J_32665 [Pseudomonas aeruginosa]
MTDGFDRAGRAFPPLYRRTVAAAPRGRRSERHARRVARDRTGRRPGPGFPRFKIHATTPARCGVGSRE